LLRTEVERGLDQIKHFVLPLLCHSTLEYLVKNKTFQPHNSSGTFLTMGDQTMRDTDSSERTHSGNEKAYDVDVPDSRSSEESDNNEDAQAGVKRIEAVSKSWTTTSLVIAYVT
jgi:hypothetical protein